MELPFTRDAFAQVFTDYNQAIWPIQLVAWLMGAAATCAILLNRTWSAPLVFALLALLWAWTGIAYHALHFTDINRAAYGFGFAFAVEAMILLMLSPRSRDLRFGISTSADFIGFTLIVYGLAIYPIATLLWTHPYPTTPMFGVTPCPTVIFTFGVLLLAKPQPSPWLFVVPVLWAVVGGSAAVLLGVPEDWALFAALAAWPVAAKLRPNQAGERPR